jgi:hypothetical protein
MAAVVAALAVWWWRSQQTAASPAVSPAADTQATNPPPTTAVSATKPEFQKLKGQWLRPDGGYVVEIKSVDDGGKMDATYSNPRPINVAKAHALQESGIVKVFIELRDVNYPGSTYTLAYNPARDQLEGVYFQALQRESYEVVFERIK